MLHARNLPERAEKSSPVRVPPTVSTSYPRPARADGTSVNAMVERSKSPSITTLSAVDPNPSNM